MKKLLSGIVILILTITMFAFPVSAAGNGTLSLSGAEGKQGDTVTVNVNLNSNPGLITMRFTISWGDGLELANVSDAGLLAGWTQPAPTISSPYTLRWADSLSTTNSGATGKIATLTFKIKENATVGNQNVTLTFSESRDANGGKNTFGNATATIKVNCKTHSYSGWTKTNDNSHSRTCSACGATDSQNHTWDGGTVKKPASCKETGVKEYTCTACNATKEESIPKTSNHSWGKWEETKKATCTAPGSQSRKCSVCSLTENTPINAIGHSFGGWSETVAPKCTSEGQEKRSCTRSGCSYSETRAVAALGHSFSNPTVTKQPTCTETGTETGTCTRCNQKTTNVVKATGHRFGSWKETTPATCTQAGQSERACEKCGQKETRAIDALGHDFENPTLLKEATLSSTGLMEGKCKRCNEATQEVIPCKAVDNATGISVEAQEGVFAEGTVTDFSIISKDDGNYESVKNAVADKGDKFAAYQIQYMKDGAAVTSNGEYTLLLPNADKVSEENMLVLYIATDGTVTEKAFMLKEDGTIVVKTAESGTYVVVDKDKTEQTGVKDEPKKNDVVDQKVSEKQSINIGLIIVIVVILIVGAIITVLLIKKNKEKNYPE